jgi:hypothetical protein
MIVSPIPSLIPMLEYYPLMAIYDYLFNIFGAVLMGVNIMITIFRHMALCSLVDRYIPPKTVAPVY